MKFIHSILKDIYTLADVEMMKYTYMLFMLLTIADMKSIILSVLTMSVFHTLEGVYD